MYVKPTQKTKKCLRCRRTYQVSKIERELTIDEVEGMSTAVERIKELQHQLAVEELGAEPDLTTSTRFTITSDLPIEVKKPQKKSQSKRNNNSTSEQKFSHLLCQLSKKYISFPKYLIGLASMDYGIEPSESDLLIRRFIKEGKLKCSNDNYFKYEKKKQE
jgi:hypothetical protein